MSESKNLQDRIALITGATRGIGRSAALSLAKQGAHVILLARTKGGLEEVDDEIRSFGGAATLIPMNLKHGQKIDQLGPSIYERWGRLDILIANAGILGPLSPLGHIKDSDWDQVIDINLNSNWRLIRTLDPCLRKAPSGRAVFLTSNAPQKCKAYWGPYSVSKAALEALVRTYASETENTTINVNLLNPGTVATNMRAQAYPGEDQSLITQPDELGNIIVEMSHADFQKSGQTINFADYIDNVHSLVE